MNSLSDAREFYDPEVASSSGLHHVPSHPMRVPSARGMIRRDSCLPLHERNSLGTPGNVFESLLVRGEPSSAHFENSKNLASSSCGLRAVDRGKIKEQGEGMRQEPQSSTIPIPRLARNHATWNPCKSYWRNLFSKLYDGKSEKSNLGAASRKCPDSVDTSAGRSISIANYALSHYVFQSQSYGLKK